MKAGLDYKKLIEYFSDEALKENNQSLRDHAVSAEASEDTFVERVTFKKNGEVQISTWEHLPSGAMGCDRYTYRPSQRDLRELEKTYGRLMPGTSKALKKKSRDGRWVRVTG